MSSAQWAEFVSSVGRGDGTPCTLRYAPISGAQCDYMPQIEKIETKHATHYREINDMARKMTQRFEGAISKLSAELDSGKSPSKTTLREILKELQLAHDHTPSNMQFVVKSAEEALEAATASAKIEVESYIGIKAQQLGLKRISELAQIEDRSDSQETS